MDAGKVIPCGEYDVEHNYGSDMPEAQRVVDFAMIGASILGIMVIAPCIWLCDRRGRRGRKKG